ncbi:uncharacterized protein RSE6_06111 [Rhynchosporium secalis]|uniref:RBR-type E3 ubiquitin transferase n=1 Tax=Rhynchosporium secalis TaxID=38038 RepID=A0A1E1M9P3_RHYSE|nr:uncharacterized protein RSE6_06111 [Rhynchosporium secalis]
MMTATRITGNWPLEDRPWPLEDREEASDTNLRLNTNLPQGFLQPPNMASASSTRGSRDELFFDCGLTTGTTDQSEEAFASYLAFEPVVESVSRDAPVDWRRYEPPPELLTFQESTSPILRSMLPVAIERLRTRHEEEELRRAAAARRERPISRVGRASVKPRRDRESLSNEYTSNVASLNAAGSSRLSGASAISFASIDSGYTSMLIAADPHPEPITQPKRTRNTSSIFSALFGRKANIAALTESNVSSSTDVTQTSEPLRSAPPIIEPARPAPIAEPSNIECVSCFDDFDAPSMITLSCHSYCTECFQRLINTALESETHWPAKCCLNAIPSANILPHLDHATKTKYHQRDAEWSIPTSDRIYCHISTCSVWIPPKNLDSARTFAKCTKCSKKTCALCRGAHHNGSDCPQDPAVQATTDLAELEGWKRCYSCHAFVEHNKGCRHMTCRCKAQFCYICGDRWKTCACTDEQLLTMQAQVESRRREAAAVTRRSAAETAREITRQQVENLRREAEAGELRGMLQEIEAFERAEEERLIAELEVLRIREEAEQRVRDEERRRVEEERLASVHHRFQRLSVELEVLSDNQRILMAERYEFEIEVLKKERRDQLDVLAVRQPAEMNALAVESLHKVTASEARFEQEYQARLEEERRIEDAYVVELRVFWNGKPDAEYRVRDARDELRENQDKEYRFWDAYRRKQLDAVGEGESRKMEAMRVRHESERRAVEGRAGIDEVERMRRVVAESRWVEAVVVERGSILMEMEQEDYARGG